MALFHRKGRTALAVALGAVLSAVVACSTVIPGVAQATPSGAADESNPLGLKAQSAELVDVATDEVLYHYGEHTKIQPASLAKLMTFELTLQALHDGHAKLDEPVTVSEKAWRLSMDQGVSRMFIEVGDQVPLETMLYGLMVASGNDAAVAIAEHLAGSEEAFVAQMNKRAAELGMTETHYVNSHGLYADGQYTTAADTAKLAVHILRTYPDATKYTSPPSFEYGGISQPNWNGLVRRDARVDGLKTGHLSQAGYHMTASAQDGDMRLVAVVMGTTGERAREDEALALLNYGFSNYVTLRPDIRKVLPSLIPVYKGGVRMAPVETKHTVAVTVAKDEANSLKIQADLPPFLEAPVRKGTQVGTLRLSTGGRTWEEPVVATQAVPRGGLFRVAWDSVRLFFRNVMARF